MTLANVLKDKVIIQVKTAVRTALGQTVVWKPVETRYARVIPLDVRARAVYQQMQSEVSHKVVLRGTISLSIGNNRLLWGSKTLVPVEPPQIIGDTTVIVVKET